MSLSAVIRLATDEELSIVRTKKTHWPGVAIPVDEMGSPVLGNDAIVIIYRSQRLLAKSTLNRLW
jgi:hypothetical protein